MNWFKKSDPWQANFDKYRVLFVCTGNVCRSPIAEGILKKVIEEQGANLVSVSSAGTIAVEGLTVNFIAMSVATMNGVNLMGHRSRKISRKLMERNDLVIAMAQDHYDYLVEHFPKHKDKIVLLKNCAQEEPVEDPDVFDPINSDGDVFREVYAEIEEEVRRIAPKIVTDSMEKLR